MPISKVHQTVAALVLLSLTGAASATELLGAEEFLQQVQAVQASAKTKAPAAADSMKKLTKDAAAYNKAMVSMEPKKAAATWMGLVTRWLKLSPSPQDAAMPMRPEADSTDQLSLLQLFANLPAPESWPELQRLAEGLTSETQPRHKAILSAVTAKLNDENLATSNALSQLEVLDKKSIFQHRSKELQEVFLPTLNDQGSVIDRFTSDLKSRKKDDNGAVIVPDLLAYADKSTVEPLLLQALLHPKLSLRFTGNSKTLEFARELALQNIHRMKSPKWDLVYAPHCGELFAAYMKKFNESPVSTDTATTPSAAEALGNLLGLKSAALSIDTSSDDGDYEKSRAQAYQYLDLVSSGSLEQARRLFIDDGSFVTEMESALKKFPAAYSTHLVYAELMRHLDEDKPKTQLWRITGELAKKDGILNEHLEKLRSALESGEINAESQIELTYALANHYLYLNKPDLAAHYMEKASASKAISGQYDNSYAAKALISMGRLLDKPEWSQTGIEHLIAIYKESHTKKRTPWDWLGIDRSIVDGCLQINEPEKAEHFLLEALKTAAKSKDPVAQTDSSQLLPELAKVYSHSERYDDVLSLLNDAPWWPVDDAGRINPNSATTLVGIARAVERAGHKDKAELLLKNYIIGNMGNDSAYDALTSMTGSASIPWLDELAKRDRFEERPLIWKAIVLARDGNLEEAEKAARGAMKIDPTDGEQPKGARLLAYAVLADVLSRNGETSESATFKKVVAAVRLAERGDELNEVGLADEAIKVYQAASKDFSDAYCVEWRLARRLQEQGDEAGATAHYTKAFELMPNQFGRLANLCFGCEEVFKGSLSQTVAERVLQGLASKPDVKPTVYDLLGQLRESQGRYAEAAGYFRTAIEMDPEYFDALKHLYDIADDAYLSDQERVELAKRLLQVDPFRKHFNLHEDVAIPSNILYEAGERDRKWFKDARTPIYPLAAAAERLAGLKTVKARESSYTEFTVTFNNDALTWAGPAEYLVRQKWLSKAIEALGDQEPSW